MSLTDAHAFEDVRHRWNISVETRDGIGLATDLYLPKGEGPYPAVLGRTPYNKNQPAVHKLITEWTQRGYAFVAQDCRGRGDSQGDFTPYVNEGRDGYDTIEWVAEQHWSDGNVVLRGASYGGLSCWMTALEQPPHLRAMVVLVSPSDPFVEFPTSGSTPMMIYWHRLTGGRVVQSAEGVEWMKVYEHLPLMELDERAGFYSRAWREAMSHTFLDEYWIHRCYQHRFGELAIPVMHISGWYDDEQVGTPRNYIGMSLGAKTEAARIGQRLLMGPWGHAVNSTQKLGEVDFGSASIIDLEGYVVKWLDFVLGRTDSDVPMVRIFVMGENRWRDEAEWPPARTRFTDYYLRSDGNANSRFGDGVLTTELPGEMEATDAFVYDPARPVPFITDQGSGQIGGPDDYSAIEQRADVLCYTTQLLDADLEATGPVKLVLHASSSAVDTDFTSRLIDVHPTGFCQRICDGVVRGRHRQGPKQPALLEPGTVYEFEIDMWNTSHVFKAGHRVRLEISSSAFPKYDRNLNTGEDIGSGTRMERAMNTILHDAGRPSRLILPVIPN